MMKREEEKEEKEEEEKEEGCQEMQGQGQRQAGLHVQDLWRQVQVVQEAERLRAEEEEQEVVGLLCKFLELW